MEIGKDKIQSEVNELYTKIIPFIKEYDIHITILTLTHTIAIALSSLYDNEILEATIDNLRSNYYINLKGYKKKNE